MAGCLPLGDVELKSTPKPSRLPSRFPGKVPMSALSVPPGVDRAFRTASIQRSLGVAFRGGAWGGLRRSTEGFGSPRIEASGSEASRQFALEGWVLNMFALSQLDAPRINGSQHAFS